jgi:hypothetical protein
MSAKNVCLPISQSSPWLATPLTFCSCMGGPPYRNKGFGNNCSSLCMMHCTFFVRFSRGFKSRFLHLVFAKNKKYSCGRQSFFLPKLQTYNYAGVSTNSCTVHCFYFLGLIGFLSDFHVVAMHS